MPEIVDSRDVLDANACLKLPLSGVVLGAFQRTGPNPWDDYRFVPDEPGSIEVHAGIEIQLERHGTDFRMRKEGYVIRVRWSPGPADPEELTAQSVAEQRRYFVKTYLADYDDAPGMGAAAWIAKKLGEGD